MLGDKATLRLLRKIRKQVGLNITEIDQTTKKGVTALMKACWNGNYRLVGRLLAAEADPNRQDRNGDTPLAGLVRRRRKPQTWHQNRNDAKLLRLLKQTGADLETRDNDDLTPLMRAAVNDNTRLIQTLIRLGADISRETSQGAAKSLASPIPGHAWECLQAYETCHDYVKCSECGERVPSAWAFTLCDDHICKTCYHSLFAKCVRCGDTIHLDEDQFCETEEGLICEDCEGGLL